ncbi:MAG: DNA-binding protein [Deltaproteobacteria bacterium]|nr:DNA-binding protein [Deltaproteobacteria bacterium]
MGLYYRLGTLEMWRHRGVGPRYYKVSRRVYYDPEGLRAFAEGRPVQTCDSVDVSALADRR